MSSYNRRIALTLTGAAFLAGCGFTPVYGPGGSGTALRDRVRVAAPADRTDFVLVSRLEERLGRGAAPLYDLDYVVATDQVGLAVTAADDTTRVNINGQMDFVLSDRATGAPVVTGQVSTFTAYSTTGSPVATAAAQRDAEDRLMIALADQALSQLLARAPGRS